MPSPPFAPPPERLTVTTCIGCGAMSVPGACAGGCGPERKLELVAGSELDEVLELESQAERRSEVLAGVLARFLALRPAERPPAALIELARAALRDHAREAPAAVLALAAEPEPRVTWWCERCGGLDAPQPCIGVCVHRPAEWASLDALERGRRSARVRVEDERRLARTVRAIALTRPRPDAEAAHWQALRDQAAGALALNRPPRRP
jgi:hypothetical protein